MADLIDRDALMKEICENECGSVCDEECENVMCNYYDYIMDASAVNRWIPCAERMPDKDEFVLCFCRANITEVLYWNGSSWHSTDAYRGFLSGFVTHWMPLPESPEKE